ncbi:MAG TPA: hypothetical protein VMT32_00575 [Bryobacteraceae bacterium]|nr:hypothetical protein [Bryobacteraceae bacterium]
MAGKNTPVRSRKRRHIVLVPGFGGFDALGQLEYYGGVTPVFHKRKAKNEVLHYFDNLPTAAVSTRAARLERYLARRIARGEMVNSDEIVLVGHSTGGLDIRWLLWHPQQDHKPIVVDGGAEVAPDEIRERVRRVVFLSVPHWGTNIADWVQDRKIGREAVVTELRGAVAGSQVPLLDRVEDWVSGGAACLTGAGLLRAVQDSLREADERCGKSSPERSADAHEAASQLELYLRHMASDFRAIDDLTSRRPKRGPLSPAHYDNPEREVELAVWDGRPIETLSYVTLGKRIFPFKPGCPAPPLDLVSPLTSLEIATGTPLSAGTDIVYRFCYRACAGGPFGWPDPRGKVTRRLNGSPKHAIELWDNDGIVNTASMLWRRGENVLVACDHMDIVGQYQPVKASGEGRTYQAYDLLKSDRAFDETFHSVWKEIFDFCAG